MNDELYGTRDKRGYWKPNNWQLRLPIFTLPFKPILWLRFLFGFPGYFWPWPTVWFGITWIAWRYFTPSLETMRELRLDWIFLIFARNAVLVLVVYGAFHTLLYIRRSQKTDFKYNSKWPDTDNSTFLFRNQTAENVFWAICSGVPVWTAYEAFTWWMFANGNIPYVNFLEHPIYFLVLLALIPLWREAHFYVIHRLIHIRPIYDVIHKVHHHNVNPGPWSGLSMHTFEHILYFSSGIIHFLVPSHPLLPMFQGIYNALSPAKSHSGFARVMLGDRRSMPGDHYFHYLHHKLIEVNFGDRLIPFDEWFGTAHDGSLEADERLFKRLKDNKE